MSTRRTGLTLGMIAALTVGMGYGTAASAGTGACLSQLTANINGEEIDHRDCVENVSQPEAVFREGCEATAKESDMIEAEGMPGVEIHSQSTQYVATGCPANPQGQCNGVADGEINFLYWDRTPDQLAQIQQACTLQGGVWQN